MKISICTLADLDHGWLVEHVGTGDETYRLVASKTPSLVYVER